MQYMLLIYEDEEQFEGGAEGDAWREILQAHMAFSEKLVAAGVMRGGAGLQPTDTARTLRKKGGGYVTLDGPYAETKEQFGGYYVIEVDGIEAALAWARELPLQGDGSVEVRPVIEMDAPAG